MLIVKVKLTTRSEKGVRAKVVKYFNSDDPEYKRFIDQANRPGVDVSISLAFDIDETLTEEERYGLFGGCGVAINHPLTENELTHGMWFWDDTKKEYCFATRHNNDELIVFSGSMIVDVRGHDLYLYDPERMRKK